MTVPGASPVPACESPVMTRTSTQKLAQLERRRQIAELALQGLSQTAIAGQLGVTQGTVSRDLAIIREEWRNSTLRDFDEARGVELQRLDLIIREAWAAWQRSQKPQQSASFTGDTPGPQSQKKVANRVGDPRFLEQINKCIAQRRALLGLDVVEPFPLDEDLFHDNLTPEERIARAEMLLDHLRQPSPITGPPIGASEPRPVRPADE